MTNIKFKEFFKQNKQYLVSLPPEIKTKIYQKAKIKPFQRSVLKFRDIFSKQCSPLEKLFYL